MGCLLEWCCRDCGAGESFLCGGGFSDFNPPDVVEQVKRGDFGQAMKVLLGKGIPDGWTVLREYLLRVPLLRRGDFGHFTEG